MSNENNNVKGSVKDKFENIISLLNSIHDIKDKVTTRIKKIRKKYDEMLKNVVSLPNDSKSNTKKIYIFSDAIPTLRHAN